MIRTAILFLSLFVGAAAAQTCPAPVSGWTLSWQNQPISSATYDSSTSLLYLFFGVSTPVAFSNVPYAAMQGLSSTRSPVDFYTYNLLPVYHALLLNQQSRCPLLNENGAYLWTD